MRFTALIAAAVLAWLPAAHAADSRLDKILADKVLRVGSTGDYKPFTYLNPDSKQFEGIDIELAADLAKALGVELTVVKTSWPSLMDDFKADKFDIAMGGVSVTLDRQKVGLFSLPYLVDGKAAIARCADTAKYASLAEIDKAGVRVITNPGGTNEKFDRANLKQAAIEVYNDNVTIFDQLLAGKADVMITDASETRLQQKLRPGLCSIHPDKPFNFSEKAYWLQRDPVWKAFVDQWLHQAIQAQQVKAVMAQWMD